MKKVARGKKPLLKECLWHLFVCIAFSTLSCTSTGKPEGTSAGKPGHLFLIVQDGKYGYMDRTGKVAIKPRFDEAGQFSGWMARVLICDSEDYDHEFLIDRSGKVVWEFRDDEE